MSDQQRQSYSRLITTLIALAPAKSDDDARAADALGVLLVGVLGDLNRMADAAEAIAVQLTGRRPG